MIYADHAATTPCLPEVADLLRRVLVEDFGNPSSRNHPLGRAARGRIDAARAQVAAALGARDEELVFTSGATESCNLAVIGVIQRLLATRPKLVVIATEHPAVLESARACAAAGAELVVVDVDAEGRPDPAQLAAAIDQRTALVAAMLVNNETGVVHDLPGIAELAHRHGALLLCDATQGLGRLPLAVDELGCDLLACTAHKAYGPKGNGVLWLRRGLFVSPLIHGGGQERGIRPGTENVAGIAGFGLACELVTADLTATAARLERLQATLEQRLAAALPGLVVHGAGTRRAPGTSFVSLPDLPRGWLAQLSAIGVSGGSSCATGEPSHSLAAMGVPRAQASNAIRVSLGRDNTEAEVATIAQTMIDGANRLRERAG